MARVVGAAGLSPAHSDQIAGRPAVRRRLAAGGVRHLGVVAGFSVLGVLVWWRVWVTGHPGTTITCRCGDPAQELWFLRWTPWALAHGHNPFFTTAIFAGRGGANMLANTSWILLSLALAPVTELFGPVTAFNVAAVAGPVASAWAFWVAARRVTPWLPAQLLGALIFGFSPFVLWNDPYGHLDFTVLCAVPLAFAVLHDVAVTRRRTPVAGGVLLGALVVGQFFIGTELLALGAVAAAAGAVAVVAVAPRFACQVAGRLAVTGAVAGGIAVVVLAWPVWFALLGPRHVTGAVWPRAAATGAPWSAPWTAGAATGRPSAFGVAGGYFGGAGPNFSPALPTLDYLGLPLLALLAVSAPWWARRRLGRWAAVLGGAAWALALGTTAGTELGPGPELQHWWLPWKVLSSLPVLSSVEPIRFGAFVPFAAGLVVVVGLDAARRWARRPGWSQLVPAAAAVAVAAALVPVGASSALPYTVHPGAVPAWVTGVGTRLAPGTVVATVPFADQEAMGWQAETDFAFRLAGGFAVVPSAGGRSQFVVPPGGAAGMLAALSPGVGELPTRPPPSGPADARRVRRALARWGVGVVVVTPEAGHPAAAVAFLTAVLGRPPAFSHGSWVWRGIGGSPVLDAGRALLDRCARGRRPGAAAACVLTRG